MKNRFQQILSEISNYFSMSVASDLKMSLSVNVHHAHQSVLFVTSHVSVRIMADEDGKYVLEQSLPFMCVSSKSRAVMSEAKTLRFFKEGPRATANNILKYSDSIKSMLEAFMTDVGQAVFLLSVGEAVVRRPDVKSMKREIYNSLMTHFGDERKEDESALIASMTRPKTTIESIKRQLDELVIPGVN